MKLSTETRCYRTQFHLTFRTVSEIMVGKTGILVRITGASLNNFATCNQE